MPPPEQDRLTARSKEQLSAYAKFRFRATTEPGTLIGGAAGGVAGSMIGGSDAAHILGAIGGAVVGGMAGDAAQGALSRQGGYEYVVQLDTGGLITVTQGTDVLLTPGQKCLVLYGKQARVVPYNGI